MIISPHTITYKYAVGVRRVKYSWNFLNKRNLFCFVCFHFNTQYCTHMLIVVDVPVLFAENKNVSFEFYIDATPLQKLFRFAELIMQICMYFHR